MWSPNGDHRPPCPPGWCNAGEMGFINNSNHKVIKSNAIVMKYRNKSNYVKGVSELTLKGASLEVHTIPLMPIKYGTRALCVS
jgi:hypothetical protein